MTLAQFFWNAGLEEAVDLQVGLAWEPSWEAEDTALDLPRGEYTGDLGADAAFELQYALYGSGVLCECCFEYLCTDGDYHDWVYHHKKSHLSFILG